MPPHLIPQAQRYSTSEEEDQDLGPLEPFPRSQTVSFAQERSLKLLEMDIHASLAKVNAIFKGICHDFSVISNIEMSGTGLGSARDQPSSPPSPENSLEKDALHSAKNRRPYTRVSTGTGGVTPQTNDNTGSQECDSEESASQRGLTDLFTISSHIGSQRRSCTSAESSVLAEAATTIQALARGFLARNTTSFNRTGLSKVVEQELQEFLNRKAKERGLKGFLKNRAFMTTSKMTERRRQWWKQKVRQRTSCWGELAAAQHIGDEFNWRMWRSTEGTFRLAVEFRKSSLKKKVLFAWWRVLAAGND